MRPVRVRPLHVSGFVLPVVVVAITVATAIAGALVTATLRSLHGARASVGSEQVLHTADAALTSAVLALKPEVVANSPIGEQQVSNSYVGSIAIEVTTVRTTPLTVLINAKASETGAQNRAAKELSRIVSLDASSVPISAAATLLGESNGSPQVLSSGVSTGNENGCGSTIDTASTTALAITSPVTLDTFAVSGDPSIRRVSSAAADSLRALLQQRISSLSLLPEVAVSAVTLYPEAIGGSCVSKSGEPRRSGGVVIPCTSQWPVRLIAPQGTAVTINSSRHQGLLVINGDLVVAGHLEVRGALIVNGTIDASGGTVDVTGALFVANSQGGTSKLGNTSRVMWSRCALLQAVTPLATFASPPVLSWAQRW